MARVVVAQAKGDGIGPEIMDAATGLFLAAGVGEHVDFVPVEMGKSVFEAGDSRGMTDGAIRAVEDCGLLFKGPMETPKGKGGKSINVTLRKLFNTFANFRHFRTLPGVPTVYSKAGITLDFSIVRENIEDTYGGVERRLTADVVESKRLISAPGCDEVVARVKRLLPRQPERIVVVDASRQPRVLQQRIAQAVGFVTTGDTTVYLKEQASDFQNALRAPGVWDYVLAITVWHEMAHIAGANELEAQLAEEALWNQFVVERRVDSTRGLAYLSLLRRRRAPEP